MTTSRPPNAPCHSLILPPSCCARATIVNPAKGTDHASRPGGGSRLSDADGYGAPAVAGSGTIASGLAAAASDPRRGQSGPQRRVRLARRGDRRKLCGKIDGADANLRDDGPADLEGGDLIVEAIVEEHDVKADLLGLANADLPRRDLATTTSSLSIAELGERAGGPSASRPARLQPRAADGADRALPPRDAR